MMTEFTPIPALIGGALLGFAAVCLMMFNGRIAGISGILNGVFSAQPSDRLWRVLFIAGLVLGGAGYQFATQTPLITRESFPVIQLVIAGLLVGFGTRIGSGCTSGHGVCGIARLSRRSIYSTLVFLGTGALVATAVYLIFGSHT